MSVLNKLTEGIVSRDLAKEGAAFKVGSDWTFGRNRCGPFKERYGSPT